MRNLFSLILLALLVAGCESLTDTAKGDHMAPIDGPLASAAAWTPRYPSAPTCAAGTNPVYEIFLHGTTYYGSASELWMSSEVGQSQARRTVDAEIYSLVVPGLYRCRNLTKLTTWYLYDVTGSAPIHNTITSFGPQHGYVTWNGQHAVVLEGWEQGRDNLIGSAGPKQLANGSSVAGVRSDTLQVSTTIQHPAGQHAQ